MIRTLRNLAPILLPICVGALGYAQLQPRRQVVAAARPPASTLPAAATRQSTALAAAARINPARPKELASFTVTNADGTSFDVRTFAGKDHWLLLYRLPDCAACDRLMSGMAQASAFRQGAGMVVVVAGVSPAALAKTQAQFPQWSAATWVADTPGSARQALKMRGTPMLYGMNGTAIAFALAGMPGGADQVSGVAASWVAPAASMTPGAGQ